MARTIAEIKKTMTDAFMADSTIRAKYGLSSTDTFNGKFSSVSIENIIFYIVAACCYTLEVLFDAFKTDVDGAIESVAHRPKWYRDKALEFMKGKTLVTDTDYYDTTSMTDAEISEAKVVKYAAATESADSSILTIKVAGDTNGIHAPLDNETETQLKAYLAEIKDVGVRIKLVNVNADIYNCSMDVYYNPMVTTDNLSNIVKNAIKDYIGNLPFDGVYTEIDCVKAVMDVEGVELVKINSSSIQADGDATATVIDAYYRPKAGYMTAGSLTINLKTYDE